MRKFIYIALCALLFTTGYLSLSLMVHDNNTSKLPGTNISITQEVDFSKMNIAKFETSNDNSSQDADFEPYFNNATNNTTPTTHATATSVDNSNLPIAGISEPLASASSTNSTSGANENPDIFISKNKDKTNDAAGRSQSYGFKAISMSADLTSFSTKQAVNSADYHDGDITHPGGAPDGPAIPVGDGLICMLIFAIAYITYIYKRTETAKKRTKQSSISL